MLSPVTRIQRTQNIKQCSTGCGRTLYPVRLWESRLLSASLTFSRGDLNNQNEVFCCRKPLSHSRSVGGGGTVQGGGAPTHTHGSCRCGRRAGPGSRAAGSREISGGTGAPLLSALGDDVGPQLEARTWREQHPRRTGLAGVCNLKNLRTGASGTLGTEEKGVPFLDGLFSLSPFYSCYFRAPGLSLAEQVPEVCGRGAGRDPRPGGVRTACLGGASQGQVGGTEGRRPAVQGLGLGRRGRGPGPGGLQPPPLSRGSPAVVPTDVRRQEAVDTPARLLLPGGGKMPHLCSGTTQAAPRGRKPADGPQSGESPASCPDSCAPGRQRPQATP